MVLSIAFHVILQCWGPNPGLCTYRTSFLLLNHNPKHSAFWVRFSSVFQDCLKQTIFLPQLSGAGARVESHHVKCWLILQSAQHWELLSGFERVKMWFLFYAKMNFDREAHNLFPSWSLFQRMGLPSKTRVLYSNCSAGLWVARNHKWIREAMAVSINCPNSKATRRNKITMLFVMGVYFQ